MRQSETAYEGQSSGRYSRGERERGVSRIRECRTSARREDKLAQGTGG